MTPTSYPPRRSALSDPHSYPCRSALGDVMADFSIRMKNVLHFSSCAAPHTPITRAHEEIIGVELCGDLLTISEVRSDSGRGHCIYAQRTIDLAGATAFMILPQLPFGVSDGLFFPALGTVVVFDTTAATRRRLRAVGTDINSGRCHGWIFDAVEE